MSSINFICADRFEKRGTETPSSLEWGALPLGHPAPPHQRSHPRPEKRVNDITDLALLSQTSNLNTNDVFSTPDQ